MKKKNWIVSLLLGISVAFGAFALSSCDFGGNGGNVGNGEQSSSEQHVHAFGDWVNFAQGQDTPCEERLLYRICDGCNSIEWRQGTQDDHEWQNTYNKDETHHWFTCENCGAVSNKEAHDINSDGVCADCEYFYPTEGLVYELSDDGTYAMVIDYVGVKSSIFIGGSYQGAPVTSIGEYAFYWCSSLTSVAIGDSVTSIGEYAFYWCSSLTSVVIGDSVTSIGDGTFDSCRSLTSIIVSTNNTAYQSIDGNLYSKDGKTLIQYAIGKTDVSFTIPDSVTSIGYQAFYNCESLTSVVIGDSVTSIGEMAFYSCSSLTSVVIGDSVTSIGSYAFNGCRSLTSVYYQGTASEWAEIEIGNNAFPLTKTTRYYSESAPTESGKYWHYDENGNIVIW